MEVAKQEAEPFLSGIKSADENGESVKQFNCDFKENGYHISNFEKGKEWTASSKGGVVEMDLEWDPSMPTWMQSEDGLPTMKEARRFYRYLMPLFIVMNLGGVIGPVVALHFLLHRLLRAIDFSIFCFIITALGLGLITSPLVYIYHYFRLRGSTELPKPLPQNGRVQPKPLLHAVVVVAYKEPIEVLHRTFESIAAQKGLGRKPIAVFATECRDDSRHASARELREAYGSRLDRIVVTEHTLCEGETAGKSSNENHALRELRRQIDAEGIDPFEVMVTIVDADSILSTTYLAHVEDNFYRMPDGRRLIYNGPLNTYRNFAEAGLLIQFWELRRVHTDTFYNPFLTMHPQSNYSLTLGFVGEIDYWTPDNMPEDIHTSIKAALLKMGANTTISIPAVICNDLVSGLQDRYTQAKRHQWGITEITYCLGVICKMRWPSLGVWMTFWGAEANRVGSFFESCSFSGAFIKAYLFFFFMRNSLLLTWEVKAIMFTFMLTSVVRWVMFWVAEICYWRSPIMAQFPIERVGMCRWFALILFSPLMEPLTEMMFYIIPTLHCLFHVTFVGELSYVTAPKGTQQKPAKAAVEDSPLDGQILLAKTKAVADDL